MNLVKLFETQRVLDERIMEKHPELKGQNNLDWKVLALQVELGECANEWRGFKKWSNDQESRTQVLTDNPDKTDKNKPWIMRNPLLEEYVDCLHFILSIGNDLYFRDGDFFTSHKQNTQEQFLYTIQKACDLNRYHTLGNYEMLFCSFLALGEMLGFTWKQIEAAYYEKNEINHERQNTGY